jgi:2-phosphosulfolactate phosphatase
MESCLEVLFTPAEFAALSARDLGGTVCVVFDVLRATTSMITALGNGASAVLPVAGISEALAERAKDPAVLLAGERDGLRITQELTGSIDFDLGNSPREFTADNVRGRRLVTTTTNGTRALRACSRAHAILVSSFLNLQATADFLCAKKPPSILLVCSGTFEEAALEDVLGAGALLERIPALAASYRLTDSAVIARQVYQNSESNLFKALSASRNAQRLLSRPDLAADVVFCLQKDIFSALATMEQDGWVRKFTQ